MSRLLVELTTAEYETIQDLLGNALNHLETHAVAKEFVNDAYELLESIAEECGHRKSLLR